MKKIEEKIERLAELNRAATMIGLDDNLKNERESLHHQLIELNVTTITDPKKSKWGFHFIGENSSKYTQLYLDAFNNF